MYAYIEGDHEPQELWQFANVANILASIHEKRYVHGDVRIENIVFGWEKPGVLIDFDLWFDCTKLRLYRENKVCRVLVH